jgi:outer membrane protein OmpA-like peptidoglycan-associated protein
MTENRHFSADGKGRLFTAVEATPFIDADTDEEVDLFVCDLLSDGDKAEFEERIRENPALAAELEQRRGHFKADQNAANLDQITYNALKAIDASIAGSNLAIVPDQSPPDQKMRSRSDETRSVFHSGWKLPTWLPLAAAFVALIGIGVVIYNRGEYKGKDQDVALNSSLTPSTSPNEATVMRAQFAGFEALLAKPEITESGLRLMGAKNPEIDRRYEGRTLVVTYYDRTTRKMPFVFLPVEFKKGTVEVADDLSRANISRLTDFLKSLSSQDLQLIIEVHARIATVSESDEALSRGRAEMLQSLLETQGVPRAAFSEAKGFGADEQQIPPQTADAYVSPTQPLVLLIRSQ